MDLENQLFPQFFICYGACKNCCVWLRKFFREIIFFFKNIIGIFNPFLRSIVLTNINSFQLKKSFRTERKSVNCKTERGLISDHFSLNKCVRHIILCLIKKPRSKIYKAYNNVMKFQSDIIIFLSSRNSSFIDFSLKQNLILLQSTFVNIA